MNVNLKGVVFSSHPTAKKMIEQRISSLIINIVSTEAYQITPGLLSYGTASDGAIMVTKVFARQSSKYKIRLNGLAFGYTKPEGTRVGTPDDLAKCVLFFASGVTDFQTSSTVVVDGGVLLG